jgi:hypothetical protein
MTRASETAVLLKEMRTINAMVDYADGASEYQMRLVALALITRQYLRKLEETKP